MTAYLAVFSARYRELLQYRAAALAGLVTQVAFGLIRLMIFDAFYLSSNLPQPMTHEEVITYIWLGQALLMLIPFRFDGEVTQMIRNGNVVYELAKPVDLYTLWLARTMALRAAPTTLRAVPMAAIAVLWFGMGPPASATSAAAFAASLCGALLVTATLTTLVSITLFWTISGEGFARLVPVAAWIFSGIVLPLPFFPEWAQGVIVWLPFRGIMDVPFRLYMGHLPPEAAPGEIGLQLAWVLAMVVAGRVLLRRGLRRLEVQGG